MLGRFPQLAPLLLLAAGCSSSSLVGKAAKESTQADAQTSSDASTDTATGTTVDQPVWVNSAYLTCDWQAAVSDASASVLCGLADQDGKPVPPDPAKPVAWTVLDDAGKETTFDGQPTGSADRIEQVFVFPTQDVAHRQVAWSVAPAEPTAHETVALAKTLPGLKDDGPLGKCFADGTKAADCLAKYLPPPSESGHAPATSPAGALLFGGMYGYRNESSGTKTVSLTAYPNPATGTTSCPQGYTAQRLLGIDGVDYELDVCYAQPNGHATPVLDFGGVVGYHDQNGTVPYPNPATGKGNCPIGFDGPDVLGTPTKDYMLVLCEHRHDDKGPALKFGGFYSIPAGPTMPAKSIANPATGAPSCPAGYKAAQVYGTAKIDMAIVLCYLPMSE